MSSHALEIVFSCAGLFLIIFCCSEGFQRGWQRLKALLEQNPRCKYLVYPLAALLLIGAATLIIHSLVELAASRFSYE